MSNKQNISIFQRPAWVVAFALTAAFLWGWAFPLVKLGFREFAITPEMTGSKMLLPAYVFSLQDCSSYSLQNKADVLSKFTDEATGGLS